MNQQASWFKERVNEYGGNPYQRIIDCAKLAQKDGVIKGIIMHQGESDKDDSDWPSKVKTVYDNIVKDLNLDENTPLLAGEVLRDGSYKGANNNIAKLPQKSTNFYVVSSEGLTAGDMMKIHFTAEGYREFGKRYAEKMLEVENFEKKQRYNITVSDDSNGTANSSYSWGVTGKEIYLTATPDTGYKFKEWKVISGGVTIEDDKFTVGTEDIEIKAVFEKKVVPTPDPTATPEPTDSPTPVPESTVTPTPEITPDVSVVPTEVPSPDSSVTPTPEVTPGVSPTPEAPLASVPESGKRSSDDISPVKPVNVKDIEKTILNIKDEKDTKGSTFTLLKAIANDCSNVAFPKVLNLLSPTPLIISFSDIFSEINIVPSSLKEIRPRSKSLS